MSLTVGVVPIPSSMGLLWQMYDQCLQGSVAVQVVGALKRIGSLQILYWWSDWGLYDTAAHNERAQNVWLHLR